MRQNTTIRISGICGILGGIVLFAGDLLLFYHPTETNLRMNMAAASEDRIIWSSLSSIIATWLYLLGLAHVYIAFKPAKQWSRYITIGCFTAVLTSYGIVHGHFISIATSTQLAVQHRFDIEQATELARSCNHAMRMIVYPVFLMLTVFFVIEVWNRRTLYPRWIILFFPIIPFLLQDFIASHLDGVAWIAFKGGFLNLVMILFFSGSAGALWYRQNNAQQ